MFQFGYNSSSFNAPQNKIEAFLNISFQERYNTQLTDDSISTYFSIAVSMFLVGGMVGALSGGYVAEKFGRKKGLLYTQIFSLSGAVCMGIFFLKLESTKVKFMATEVFIPLYLSAADPEL